MEVVVTAILTEAPEREKTYQAGDPVVLIKGSYEGTPGVFLRFRQDPNWADIREWNGVVREHPVAWLALRASHE